MTPHDQNKPEGLSGLLTRFFIQSPLTPLLLIGSVLIGLIALMALPRDVMYLTGDSPK